MPVLGSTAPAPLGVRKVHKIVYNIASIFNFGLALRALATVLLSYYTRGRVCCAHFVFSEKGGHCVNWCDGFHSAPIGAVRPFLARQLHCLG